MLFSIFKGIDKVFEFFFKSLLLLSCVFIILLILITSEQVVARYIFASSSVAMQEMQWHLYSAAFLLSLTWCMKEDKHVRVDILYGRLKKKNKQWIDFLGHLFFLIPFSGVITYYGWNFVLASKSFSNSLPLDYLTLLVVSKDSMFYGFLSGLESYINPLLTKGEVSPDPGGLPFRWVLKSLIPLSSLCLLINSLLELLKLSVFKKFYEEPK